ncbi:MAG: acetyltransferase [Butyrivibrio sp.]|nr:acetyltransferase [Butyrivibrio sp.]
MKDIIIFGAGGLGREVTWLIERINQRQEEKWRILGFLDDGVEKGTVVQGFQVLGGIDYLKGVSRSIAVVCAVGNAGIRYNIIEKIRENKFLNFPNLFDPDVVYSDSINIGQGNIICAGAILSVNVEIGDFCLIDWNCTVGHETKINSFVTLYPSVNVSGSVVINEITEVGTGTHIIQGKAIGSRSIIGAGSVVIRNIPDCCTAVGNPAVPIKFIAAADKAKGVI